MKKILTQRYGVTLTELMVVIAIIAIAAAIAIPNMGPWMAVRRINSITRTMAMDYNLARSEAIRNSVQVTVNIDNSSPGSEWYSVFYAQGATTTFVVPRRDLPQEINIQNITFPGNQVVFNTRGLPVANGSLDIVSSKAPSSSNTKTITINIGGSVIITP